MKTIALIASAYLSMGMIAAEGDPPAAAGKPPAATDATSKPATALVSLWVVRFDSTVSRSDLPFDVQGLRRDPEFAARMGTRPDGRTPTDGWASQLSTEKPAVQALGFRLVMKDGQLVTEPIDKANASATPPWQIVAAPKLLVQTAQKASLSVGRPVVHLVKEEDGRLKMEEAAGAIEGVTIDLNLAWVKPEGMRFSELTLRVSRILGREPLPGVPLEVGKPIMETRETNLGLTLDKGKVAVIPLPERPDEAPILVFFTATAQ